jgi:hypothetical protein
LRISHRAQLETGGLLYAFLAQAGCALPFRADEVAQQRERFFSSVPQESIHAVVLDHNERNFYLSVVTEEHFYWNTATGTDRSLGSI